MARELTTTYRDAMAAPVRRPVVQVWAYPGGTAEEVTDDIIAWSCERTLDGQAGKATLTIANPYGRYDIHGGERGALLAPGTLVVIRQGLVTAAGIETVPVFTGEVFTAEASYRRGEGETLIVRLLDRTGVALQREITSPLYENSQVAAIVTDLFSRLGGFPGEAIALGTFSYLLPRGQFVEESLWDAGQMLVQAAGRRLYFDAEGVLRSAATALPTTPAWTYADGQEVLSVRDAWQKPPATVCTVTGRVQDPLREVGQEVLWEEVTVSQYDYGLMLDVPFSPTGAVYEEIRLEPITPLASFEQVALYAVSGTGITVKIISPGGRAITFRCYGKQVYYSTPAVTTTLEASDLLPIYGRMHEEYANPCIKDEVTAVNVAAHRLDLARWQRHRVTVRLLANPGIEPGDVIAFTHPRTGQPISLLADRVMQAGRRGQEEHTTVDAMVVG